MKAQPQQTELLAQDGHHPFPEAQMAIEKQRTEIVNAGPGPVAVSPTMRLVEMAISQNADVEKLAKVIELAEKLEQAAAKKAYQAAMNAFKANPPEINKNKHVKFGNTEYDHATLDNVCEQINQALSQHGLSHRWEMEQTENLIRVTCILTHELGHFERTTLSAGPDTSGSKNAVQAIASTVHYLQRYTLLSATGLAEAGTDNDGQGAGGPKWDKLGEYLSAIEICPSLAILETTFKDAFKEAAKTGDVQAKQKLIDAKDVRKKKLLETEAA